MSAPQTPQDLPQGEELAALVSARLEDIPDFPKPGVVFKDFTPLLRDPAASRAVVQDVVRRRQGDVDVVVGIEARGFILGAAMAYALGVGFVPVRKAGKLPGEIHSASYTLEYGTATIEMHKDAVVAGDRVLIVDDVFTTGVVDDVSELRWDIRPSPRIGTWPMRQPVLVPTPARIMSSSWSTVPSKSSASAPPIRALSPSVTRAQPGT